MSRSDTSARRHELRHAVRGERHTYRALSQYLTHYAPTTLIAYGVLPPCTARPCSPAPAPRAELLTEAERDPAWDAFFAHCTMSDFLQMSEEIHTCYRL